MHPRALDDDAAKGGTETRGLFLVPKPESANAAPLAEALRRDRRTLRDRARTRSLLSHGAAALAGPVIWLLCTLAHALRAH